MTDEKDRFHGIFEVLSRKEFLEEPRKIISFLLDYGFDRRRVNVLQSAIRYERKLFLEAVDCPEDRVRRISDSIADSCLVSKDAMYDLIEGVRQAMDWFPETESIDDEEFGKCLVTEDGGARYSLDRKTILQVDDVYTEFIIPDSVESIKFDAFYGCSSLESVVIPDSVESIEDCAFYGCSSLESVVIPDSVESIEYSAFSGCSSLESVVIPDSVKSIGYCAFYGCSSLESIVIPDSVESIEGCAFYGCPLSRSIPQAIRDRFPNVFR